MQKSLQVAVDIGGTFTDVVTKNSQGELKYFKIPTTRSDESIAVLESISRIEELWNTDASAIERFMHGTTVATNAILERKGARLGLITTRGFKDVLAIGRQMRHDLYGVKLRSETPEFLAPGRFRKEVTERISFDGEVLAPLDERELLEVAHQLVESGVEVIALCFLFSFVNSVHEKRAKELILASFPDIVVTTSHEVDPAFREYERTVVTAFDGYVKPIIERYLTRLERGLVHKNITSEMQVMQSRGGLMASEIARSKPVRLFLSGPAGGVIGARIVARDANETNIITLDIGGTSCDIALINDGKAIIRSEGVLDGYPLRVPMVDVNTIGSGGGSIAWLDAAGGLRVGPHSAGSEPGPACYGRGGKQATVTDASLVLGYINPERFSGGTFKLRKDLAEKAIGYLARELSIDLEEVALGIHRIVNAQMAEGIRLVTIQQGLDPRDFALVPLGGGGALHATSLAYELGINKIIIPPYPGVLAAAGLLAASVEHEAAEAFGGELKETKLEKIKERLAVLDKECSVLMAREAVDKTNLRIRYIADVCYVGQGYTLDIEFEPIEGALEQLYEDFIEAHRRVYGYATDAPARIVNLRSVHQAGGSSDIGVINSNNKTKKDALVDVRNIKVAGYPQGVEAKVFQRDSLLPDDYIVGPAIVEQVDTTILIEPGWSARVDNKSNLLITKNN